MKIYDAKLSSLTKHIVVHEAAGKFTAKFAMLVDGKPRNISRRITSRYFSNYSVDTIKIDRVVYLVDSQVDILHPAY